jgi:type II secretory ATPase GspE/PulE/Tfp pilus assembly ATPase PilB-like protein
MNAVLGPWRRIPKHGARPAAPTRFDTSRAVLITSADDLACMKPGFRLSLSTELDADALAGRLCPVMLDDGTVAIFSLAEHVGSDQADELARRIVQAGHRPAQPSRYVLAAPLLLAIARKQITNVTLADRSGARVAQSRTALADAFQDLLDWGVRHGASDIHLNVHLDEAESEVKYTVAGRYLAPERFQRMPTSTLMDMLSVAWMDIRGGNGAVFDPTIEQQGSMARMAQGRHIVLRWSSMAADAGPSVCLRILDREKAACASSLDQLGYLPDQLELIRRVMVSEGGAVIFAGSVGSGKSTSLATLIAGLPPDRKVITLEDPVEYLIPGSIQNTVSRDLAASTQGSFSSKLRALKRSAMADVLLGEIRDRETGLAFMDLASSGVNVYTTVHAPSAAAIPDRLASDFIGVSRDFLAADGMLKLLVFQVLIPVLCPHCALPAHALAETKAVPGSTSRTPEGWAAWLGLIQALYGPTATLRIRNPEGCDHCRSLQIQALHGYAGRTVTAELIEPGVPALPSRSALDSAMLKAFRGEVDPRDVERRFLAFETLALRRNAPVNRAAPVTLLRAVP